jgi:hypothetical protein
MKTTAPNPTRWRLLGTLAALALSFIVWDSNREASAPADLAVALDSRAERPVRAHEAPAPMPQALAPRTRLPVGATAAQPAIDLLRPSRGQVQAASISEEPPPSDLPAQVLGSALLNGKQVLVVEHEGQLHYALPGERVAGLRVDRVHGGSARITEIATGAAHALMLNPPDGVQGLHGPFP